MATETMTCAEAMMDDAIAERNQILLALDVAAAKDFIVKHGGDVPSQKLDWLRVLHLARFEVTTMPDDVRTDSHIYLARTGAKSVHTLPSKSPYLRAAIDLIFPKILTDAYIKASSL